MSPVETAPAAEGLLLRAHAYSLSAHLLSERGAGAGTEPPAGKLQRILDRLGLGQVMPDPTVFRDDAASRRMPPDYLKPLVNGRLSPYETTYEPRPGVGGGQTFRLADIAGFYRAFGFEVSGERPDHIVPELEFVALLYAKEAHALLTGQEENAETCRAARHAFLAEHLMWWLPQLSQALAQQPPNSALASLVAIILALGHHDSARPAAAGS